MTTQVGGMGFAPIVKIGPHLEPCPDCKHEAKAVKDNFTYRVQCTNCRTFVRGDDLEQAVKKWNAAKGPSVSP